MNLPSWVLSPRRGCEPQCVDSGSLASRWQHSPARRGRGSSGTHAHVTGTRGTLVLTDRLRHAHSTHGCTVPRPHTTTDSHAYNHPHTTTHIDPQTPMQTTTHTTTDSHTHNHTYNQTATHTTTQTTTDSHTYNHTPTTTHNHTQLPTHTATDTHTTHTTIDSHTHNNIHTHNHTQAPTHTTTHLTDSGHICGNRPERGVQGGRPEGLHVGCESGPDGVGEDLVGTDPVQGPRLPEDPRRQSLAPTGPQALLPGPQGPGLPPLGSQSAPQSCQAGGKEQGSLRVSSKVKAVPDSCTPPGPEA